MLFFIKYIYLAHNFKCKGEEEEEKEQDDEEED